MGAGCRNVLDSLIIERDRFGRRVLVRNWGQIGTNGRELVEEFAGEIEAGQALKAVAQAKRRRGIRIYDRICHVPRVLTLRFFVQLR